ncbi:hypothetical protein K438DRAFT_1829920, partial [Mycena galopus ATCC 62051]
MVLAAAASLAGAPAWTSSSPITVGNGWPSTRAATRYPPHPGSEIPHDGNVVFPPRFKTSQSLLACPATPLSPRSSLPRSSTSPIIERSSPSPSLSLFCKSSVATQGGAGVRTSDITLSILTLSLSPGTSEELKDFVHGGHHDAMMRV